MQAMVDQLHAAAAAVGNCGVDIVVCHEIKVHNSHRDRSGARDSHFVNSQIEELNKHISRFERCRVCPLVLPPDARFYQRDKLHLSEAGYECLLPQLLEAVPALALAPPPRALSDQANVTVSSEESSSLTTTKKTY
jgi:hypothetical protein